MGIKTLKSIRIGTYNGNHEKGFHTDLPPVMFFAFLVFMISLIAYCFIREPILTDALKLSLGAMLGGGISNKLEKKTDKTI